MSNEHQIKITRAKINALFHNITIKLDGGNGLLAKKLRISPSTLDEYLRQGREYLDKFEDILEEVMDIELDDIDDEFESRREEFKNEYMMREEINALGDKYRNSFEVYFYELREKAREKHIYSLQRELIENTTFDTNNDLNEKIKLLLLFRLVYDRAHLSLIEEKLYLKSRYTKASSKHVNAVIKDIERINPEDFGTEKKEQAQTNTTNNITNFVQLCIEREKSKQIGMLDDINKNDDNIIDV